MWVVCHQMYQTLNSGNGEPRSEEEAIKLYKSLIRTAWATPTGEKRQLPELWRTQTLTAVPNGHPVMVSAWLVGPGWGVTSKREADDPEKHVRSSFTDEIWTISSPLTLVVSVYRPFTKVIITECGHGIFTKIVRTQNPFTDVVGSRPCREPSLPPGCNFACPCSH